MARTDKEAAKAKAKKPSKKKAISNAVAVSTTVNSVSGGVLKNEQPVTPVITALPSDAEQKRLQEMLMLANLEYNKLKSKILREKKREIDSLDGQIKEFLSSYMLIGYDLNNNPVEIVSAGSTAENDALLERFRRVMFKINQNISNSNGDDPFGNSN